LQGEHGLPPIATRDVIAAQPRPGRIVLRHDISNSRGLV